MTNVFEIFIEILKYIPQKKAIQYIEQQNNIRTNEGRLNSYSLRKILQDWRDYLKFCLAFKLDFKNTFVSMPKNLLKSHNSMLNYSTNNKNKIYNNQIAQLYEKLQNIYSFQNEKFIIKIPKSAEEIINEGATLHHCVGSMEQDYIKNMANGKNVILFIRKIEYPEKPYCTVEVSKAKILQIKGYRNEQILDLELESFIDKWKNYLNKSEEIY